MQDLGNCVSKKGTMQSIQVSVFVQIKDTLFWIFQLANRNISLYGIINAGPDSGRTECYQKEFMSLKNVASMLEGATYGCGTAAIRFLERDRCRLH